jgi:glucose-1-phosphate thymidylyltransferase
MKAKGLIAAGGEATRLGELTRVVNKHLLPVGAWPMIYYPLQLLQLCGVQEVLIVTGQGHAGQVIDLLGNGRLTHRGNSHPLFDLDLTYMVQVEAGGISGTTSSSTPRRTRSARLSRATTVRPSS